MGFSISWAAVRGRPAEAVRAELGLEPTGERNEVPEGPFCATALEGGWTLVVADDCDLFVKDALLASLSAGCEVVACSVEEHVMASVATAWRDGREAWRVTHDAQTSLEHLEARGNPPKELTELQAAALEQLRTEVDPPDFVFDVPLELAKSIVGYKHDEGDETFEVMKQSGSRKSWIRRIFG